MINNSLLSSLISFFSISDLSKMEFGMGVEVSEMHPRDSQCNAEISAKVYLENETKRKADEKAKEPLAKRSQNKSRLSSQEDERPWSQKS